MKLDKIKFARLIGYLAQKVPLHSSEIEAIDNLIDIEVPMPIEHHYPKSDDIDRLDRLMMLMVEGTRKIEAIKTYRILTGYGLKESKDAVERYWVDKTVKINLDVDNFDIRNVAPAEANLGDILAQATRK